MVRPKLRPTCIRIVPETLCHSTALGSHTPLLPLRQLVCEPHPHIPAPYQPSFTIFSTLGTHPFTLHLSFCPPRTASLGVPVLPCPPPALPQFPLVPPHLHCLNCSLDTVKPTPCTHTPVPTPCPPTHLQTFARPQTALRAPSPPMRGPPQRIWRPCVATTQL